MPTLREIEAAFIRAAVYDEPAPLSACIVRDGIDPERRLDIYANTSRAIFIASLRSSFPVLLRLVGEEYFGQVAARYRRVQPSRSGDLLHTGEGFARYLRERHAADDYVYLADVAHFEWLCQSALVAADVPPLALGELQRVAQSRYDELRFELHPAARLFRSAFPIRAIWQANLDAELEPPMIDLRSGGEQLLILPRHHQLRFLELLDGEHAFLEALRSAAPLGAAIEAATRADARFDAGACLARMVTTRVIVGFH